VYLFPSLLSLFVGLTVFGIGWTVFAVAVQCHIGSIGGGRDASSNFGWYGTSVALGQMIGPLLSGVLIDTAGKGVAWLVMAAIVTATGAGLYFVIGPGMINGTSRAAGDRPRFRAADLLNLATAVGMLSSFVTIFALGVRSSFFPVYLKGIGYSASLIGAIDSVRGLTSVVARASIGPALRLLGGRFSLLTVCHLVLAAGIVTTPLCVSIPLLVANAVLIGIGFGVVTPVSQAIVFDSASAENRSVAMGVRMTGNRLAQMASPLVFGFVITGFDMDAGFVASGMLLFVMTSPMLLWWVRCRRATGRAPVV
jgi:MFS family permease